MRAYRVEDHVIDAALAGDEDALAEMTEAWLPTVIQWCVRLGGPSIDAEEAATDVMMTFVRRHHTIHDRRRVSAWLFATCRRTVANYRRSAWWRRWLPGASYDTVTTDALDADLDRAERADRVFAALEGLKARDREVLTLCYLEDRSLLEAAQILEIPEGTVKSRLSSARDRFRRRYEARS
ncbi:MAG: sigma-70 family RNA polymerase sigma factor [Myxococcota bacterium]